MASTAAAGGDPAGDRQLVVREEEAKGQPEKAVPAPAAAEEKPLKKAVLKRTVDYTGPYLQWLEETWAARDPHAMRFLQPCAAAALELRPPVGYLDQPTSSVALKFVTVCSGKAMNSVNCAAWTPGGRRCVTGNNLGDFALWNGQTFHLESVFQAHEASAVRTIRSTHNEAWLLSGDERGRVHIWKPTMQLVMRVAAHGEGVHDLALAPTDAKFCTACKDATLKVWDFAGCRCEATLLGHGTDVRTVDWHPTQCVLASGSKEPTVKLWDPRAGKGAMGVLRGHSLGIMAARWNANGNWLLTGSRDATLKVWEARMLRELQTWGTGGEEVYGAAWHPWHEDLLVASVSPPPPGRAAVQFTGALTYWAVGREACQGDVRGAHDGVIWGLAWHPVGHLLASTGGDACIRFWARTRPGDPFWRPGGPRPPPEPAPPPGGPGAPAAPPDGTGPSELHSVMSIPGIGHAEESPAPAPDLDAFVQALQPPAQQAAAANTAAAAALEASLEGVVDEAPGGAAEPTTPRAAALSMDAHPRGSLVFHPRLSQGAQQQAEAEAAEAGEESAEGLEAAGEDQGPAGEAARRQEPGEQQEGEGSLKRPGEASPATEEGESTPGAERPTKVAKREGGPAERT